MLAPRQLMFFSQSGFMPHIHCYLARPPLVWTMFLTDLMIGLAYVGIALTLWALVRKVRLQFNLIVLSFGVFILACGLTHFMEVWTLWNPDYWYAAGVKVVTAIASVGTGIYLFQLRHSIFAVAEAAKISEQRRISLEALTAELERRVEERTRDYQLSEARFRDTFQKVAIGVAHISVTDGSFLWVNPKMCEITGYTEEELAKKTFAELTAPEDRAQDMEQTQALLDGETDSYSIEKRYIHKSGRLAWVKLTRSISRDASGKPQYLIACADDITDRKRIEEIAQYERSERERLLVRLEFERNRFETAMNQLPAAVIIAEAPSGKLIFGNRAMEAVWGHPMIPSGDVSEYRSWTGFHPDGRAYEPQEWPLARSIQKGEVVEAEEVLVPRPGGEMASLQLSSAPIREHSGGIIGGVVICQDITYLRNAIRARDEFLSIASHELKTPLTSLKLQVQMRKRHLERGDLRFFSSTALQKMVDTDVRQINRVSRLVDDMLDIARISTGKLTIQKEPVELCSLINDIVERNSEQIKEARCEITVSCEAGVIGNWDRFRIEQVVSNLLTNALRYAPGKPVEIRVDASGDRVLLEFRDQGKGIAQEDHERIFQRYERAISANEVSGLGLGLHIVRKIVEMHGGRVWVESSPGRGAVFFVELPVGESVNLAQHA